ncbi:serine/threonine-protein kinase [Streptosporangium sp. CA-115845]|uniref:serine/threonine-protein kinase n=1 Tax=Streptosporangium sp. CA-115845 TaxID=3240071 RepID=UPI003D900E90
MNDRYRLRGPLGADGMGAAWLAHDDLLSRDVLAQELAAPPGIDGAEWYEHVVKQIGVIDGIRNAPIGIVHDVVLDGDRPWIVTDLEDGTSLARVLTERGRLPVEQVAALGAEVLAALTAAHRRNVLHGAVTPATVVIAAGGRVRLAGFGTGGRIGSSAGIPGFTAPECLTGPPGPASDLWSLGATLYAAVEGVPPYRRATPLASTGTVLTEPPTATAHAGPLGPVLNALLAKDPSARPSPRELGRSLRRIAATRPVRAPLVVPRSVVAAVIACSVMLAAVAGVLGARVRAGHEAEAARVAAASVGRFAEVPRACGLLTDDQFTELVPAPVISDVVGAEQTSSPGNCSWSTFIGAKLPKGLHREVVLVLKHHPPAELIRSREFFSRKSEEPLPFDGEGRRAVPGLGDEAFAYRLRSENWGKITEVVVVRVSNVVAEVKYTGKVKEDPQGRLAAGSLRSARWIVDALSRRG